MPAAAKGDAGAPAQPESLAFLIHNLKITFDAKRSVVENRYFGTCQ